MRELTAQAVAYDYEQFHGPGAGEHVPEVGAAAPRLSRSRRLRIVIDVPQQVRNAVISTTDMTLSLLARLSDRYSSRDVANESI